MDGEPRDPEGDLWDVVVIGTGAGGATAGFNLARLGRSLLFLERGKNLHEDRAERRAPPTTGGGIDDELRSGWWPHPVLCAENGAETLTDFPIGCGTGGSTAVFAMVMDRFRPQDFTPRRYFPDTRDTSLPDAWPITYEDLAPYYEHAERLYRVRGTSDPLAPASSALLDPPPASAKESAISTALTDVGLHPYRIHYAREIIPDCSMCPNQPCPHACRNDAGRICLRPAIEHHDARLLTGCHVVRLETEGHAVRRAICDWNGRRIVVRAQVFVLAAGALQSPALLQRSASARFPDGLANSSGLVGRNLMLHVSDVLRLRLKRAPHDLGMEMPYGLSLNDFYVRDGTKLGNVHVHAVAGMPEPVAAEMRSRLAPLSGLPAPVMGTLTALGHYAHRSSTAFSTVLEDLPYLRNHVRAKPGSDDAVVYEYTYPDELRARSQTLFRAFSAAVDSRFTLRPTQPLGMVNRSHVCGTCCFGIDPATSVLDRNNRAHDLDNLYVLDASFLPSSGGINPSLTIAANSLRVSETIAQRL